MKHRKTLKRCLGKLLFCFENAIMIYCEDRYKALSLRYFSYVEELR